MIKFEKIKSGMKLWDVRPARNRLGRVHSKWSIWPVEVVDVDVANRRALVSWNMNPVQWMPERKVCKYRASRPGDKPPQRVPAQFVEAPAQKAVPWKVHTHGLLKEILECSGQAILRQPIRIFGQLLAAVGERAAELDDPKLNALMCKLAIYTISDPYSPDYDPEQTRKITEAYDKT